MMTKRIPIFLIKRINIKLLIFFCFLFILTFTKNASADYLAEYWNVTPQPTPAIPGTNPVATTTVSDIDFSWAEGAPSGVNVDGFVARYTKTIGSGQYTFRLGSDDGIRMYIDNTYIAGMWIDQGYKEMTYSYTIASGDNHPLRVEYYENAGGAQVYFSYNQTVQVNYTASSHGTLTGSTTQSLLNGATSTSVTAVPSAGYRFASWSDGTTTNPRTDSGLSTNSSFTASFVLDTYVINYTASSGGEIIGSSTQTITGLENGTEVTAVPNTGYHFVSWSDDLLMATRTDSNITSSTSYTAMFAINEYSVNYVASDNGVIIGSSSQIIAHGSSTSQIEARANNNYHFVSWSDGLLVATRTDTVTSDKTYTATFAPNPSSAPVILPQAIGSGTVDFSIPMNETQDIYIIDNSGVNVLLYVNSSATFLAPESSHNFNLANHSFTVGSLDLAKNIITLNISSQPQTISLCKGENRLVDLDADSKNDVIFSFVDVYINRAEVTVKALEKTKEEVKIEKKNNKEEKKDEKKNETPKIEKKINFTKDLKFGMKNSSVKELQKTLNSLGYIVSKSGAGAKGKETDYFGQATKLALINFQKNNNIQPAVGYFGKVSRAKLNSLIID